MWSLQLTDHLSCIRMLLLTEDMIWRAFGNNWASFRIFAGAKTKTQISFAVTGKLISIFILGYLDSAVSLPPKSENFKPLTIFIGFTARYVSDMVGNPEDWFSQNEAQLKEHTKACLVSLNCVVND